VFLTRPISASAFIGRLRGPAGRRALGLALTVLVEALMLILLLTLGTARPPGVKETHTTLMTFQAEEAAEPAPRVSRPERRAAEPRVPVPPQRTAPPVPQPAAPVAAPVTTVLPMSWQLAPSGGRRRPDQTQAPAQPVYGPPAIAGTTEGDSERVGTAPNGEPLYAAQWYEEPGAEMMRSYLSTARGPGWGLIACRTAPDYRVEDCVALDEYPQGSQIARAALAAAWEFRVRPPRRGGRSLIGAWVRIRIEYDISARHNPY
jgi:protein TonB